MKRGAHHGMLIPLLLPTPTHRGSHGDILNFYSHPTNGMKISPTEVFGETGRGEKKARKRNVEHRCVSRVGCRESLL